MNVKQMIEIGPSTAEYHAYVLRQWRESATAPWRYSLQCAEGGERHGFASLEHLVAYLHQCPPLDPSPTDHRHDAADFAALRRLLDDGDVPATPREEGAHCELRQAAGAAPDQAIDRLGINVAVEVDRERVLIATMLSCSAMTRGSFVYSTS